MTSEDFIRERAARWERLRPVELTGASLRAWIGALPFPSLATMVEAFPGAGEAAAELVESEVAAGGIVELWMWPDGLRYCAKDLLRPVYASIGLHPARTNPLAGEIYQQLWDFRSAMTASQLRARLGPERTSALTIEHACQALARELKLLRVGRELGEPLWRPTLGVYPRLQDHFVLGPVVEAAATFIVQYLDLMVCDTEENCAAFLSPLVSRAQIHSAVMALEAARHLAPESLEGRPAWRLRPAAAQV